MTFQIRQAQQRDLPELLRLYRQLNPADPPPDIDAAAATLAAMINSPMTTLFLAVDGDRTVGSCTLIIVPNLTRNLKPYALIENVVADAVYRRRGVGKAVMSQALNEAWNAGCYKVMLMTGKQRNGAIPFYESLGFVADRKTGMEIRRPQDRD
jgi:GNAT superfamily N-acetyltransferase